MGIYGPEEYFKNLYPGWFTETDLSEIIFLVFINRNFNLKFKDEDI